MANSKESVIDKLIGMIGAVGPGSLPPALQRDLDRMTQMASRQANWANGGLASMAGMAGSLGSLAAVLQSQSNAQASAAVLQAGISQDTEKAKQKAVFTLATRITQLRNAPAVKITSRVPDLVGTITAWRGWKLADGKLCALGMTGVWEPKKAVRAVCSAKNQLNTSASGHDAPARDCKCGYWSFRTMELLQQVLDPYVSSVQVIGSVELWGKVVECENGFRSEFAYPKELWLLEEGLEHLSWAYGVPVRRLEV